MASLLLITSPRTESYPLLVFTGAVLGLSVYCMGEHIAKNPDVNFQDKQTWAFDRSPTGLEAHNSFFRSYRGGRQQVFQGLNDMMSKP